MSYEQEYRRKLQLLESIENPKTVDEVVQALTVKAGKEHKAVNTSFTSEDGQKFIRTALDALIRKERKSFTLDRHNEEIINKIGQYLVGSPEFEKGGKFSLTRGLFLYGKVGSGKTMLIRALAHAADVMKLEERKFGIITADEVVSRFMKGDSQKGYQILEEFSLRSWCFDDLGEEPRRVTVYGSEATPMVNVLAGRYRLFTNTGMLTHATSNLDIKDPDELQEFYGDRLRSRFEQMFNFLYLGGKDRRL